MNIKINMVAVVIVGMSVALWVTDFTAIAYLMLALAVVVNSVSIKRHS